MFKLVMVSEGVCIPASHFGARRVAAFEHAVNARYSNRVVPGVGLAVGIWSFVRIGRERLLPSCGSAVADCVFRLVVFAPFAGEAVFATIAAAAAGGLAVALPFFGIVRVPAAAMPPGSVWDPVERVWVWRPPTEEGDDLDPQGLFMDVSNDSVVRVTEVAYSRAARTPPKKEEAGGGEAPMSVFGSLYDAVYEGNQGLGNPLWWEEDEEEEEGEADEAADEAEEGADDEAEDAAEDAEEGATDDVAEHAPEAVAENVADGEAKDVVEIEADGIVAPSKKPDDNMVEF